VDFIAEIPLRGSFRSLKSMIFPSSSRLDRREWLKFVYLFGGDFSFELNEL